ncbi:MAG: metal ABC transporter permease [Clostridia bacterium]|nr:metal ABC transporter permease [Clostridia bacterium]
MTEMLQYAFMQRALLVGLLVSLCAALLGVSLVLKRYSMIGDGLSHVGFGALAIATAMNVAPLSVALPVVILAAFFLLRLSESSAIKGDAAIAMISSGSLALGVIIVSLTKGMNTDLNNFLFGSILAMETGDVWLSVSLSLPVLILFVIFYHKIFAVTFDETFARAVGLKASLYNGIIASLTAITIVLGMKMMGSLLISSLIIFPSLSAMRICRTFKGVVWLSAVVACLSFVIGLAVSFWYDTPTGATVVAVNILMFALCFVAGKLLKRK